MQYQRDHKDNQQRQFHPEGQQFKKSRMREGMVCFRFMCKFFQTFFRIFSDSLYPFFFMQASVEYNIFVIITKKV